MLRRLPLLALLGLLFVLPWHEQADAISGRSCVARGLCHKVVAACTRSTNTVALTVGTASWTVPSGVTQLTRVGALAAGGGADNGGFGGEAGGGGAYSEVDNVAVTPGNSLSLSIGVHGAGGAASASGLAGAAGGDTSVSYLGAQILLAKGGGGGSNGATGAGGAAAAGVGTIKTSGGSGGNGGNGGGGGGGAGGPHGDGQVGGDGAPSGAAGPPYPGGNGGNGDAGFGGTGGLGSTQNNVDGLPGSSGTEFGTAGSGGGGGGGVGGAAQQSNAGATGSFGAGGGGSGFGAATFPAGRDGTDGAVFVVYSTPCGSAPPPPPQNSFFVATTGSDSNAGTLAAPFLTLSQCQAAMRNSTTTKTCTIRGGIYNLATGIDLTAADNGETWQSFSADGVDSAIVDGGNTIAPFLIDGVSSLTMTSLTVRNCGQNCFVTPGSPRISNITISNNVIGPTASNNGGAGGSAGISIDNGVNVTISGNYIHDTSGPAVSLLAFAAGESEDGGLISGNVAIKNCTGLNDCGALYTSMRGSGTAGGSASVRNNYVRDVGFVGSTADEVCIYLDDNASNTIVSGNICAPPLVGDPTATSANNTACWLINGGVQNTIKGNLCDVGFSSFVGVAYYGADSGNPAPGMPNGNIGSVFTNNIVISNFTGANHATAGGVGGGIMYFENGPAANYTISTNAYTQYAGGGSIFSNGSVKGDTSPTTLTPTQMALTCTNGIYSIAPGSAVLGAPVNFPQLPTNWGPPGFALPASTNHSC